MRRSLRSASCSRRLAPEPGCCTEPGRPGACAFPALPVSAALARIKMRYIYIAIAGTILHRLVSYGIAMLGFGVAMTAFSDTSYSGLGVPIMKISGILDFPVGLISHFQFYLEHGYYRSYTANLGVLAGASLESPILWKLTWSFVVGLLLAIGYYFYRLKKYGRQPTVYWK